MTVVVDDKIMEDPDSLVMADDGKGESVNIPTFMVSLLDGQRLKDAIHRMPTFEDGQNQDEEGEGRGRKRNKVIIQADIDLMTKTDSQIDVDLWYTGAYELMQANIDLPKYSMMQEIFTEKVRFHPRILTTECSICSDRTKDQ